MHAGSRLDDSWEEVRQGWPDQWLRFHADPWTNGYLGGESLRDVHGRTAPVLDGLLAEHAGQSVLVVSHHVVLRVYLAGLLELPPAQARQVRLDNASVSIVVRCAGVTSVQGVNYPATASRFSQFKASCAGAHTGHGEG